MGFSVARHFQFHPVDGSFCLASVVFVSKLEQLVLRSFVYFISFCFSLELAFRCEGTERPQVTSIVSILQIFYFVRFHTVSTVYSQAFVISQARTAVKNLQREGFVLDQRFPIFLLSLDLSFEKSNLFPFLIFDSNRVNDIFFSSFLTLHCTIYFNFL